MAEWTGGTPEMIRFESFAQAQAERDRLQSELDALRAAVEGEADLLDVLCSAYINDEGDAAELLAQCSDRLTQLLQETKP